MSSGKRGNDVTNQVIGEVAIVARERDRETVGGVLASKNYVWFSRNIRKIKEFVYFFNCLNQCNGHSKPDYPFESEVLTVLLKTMIDNKSKDLSSDIIKTSGGLNSNLNPTDQ